MLTSLASLASIEDKPKAARQKVHNIAAVKRHGFS